MALGDDDVHSSFVQLEPFVCGRDEAILRAKNSTKSLDEKIWWCRCT